MFGVVFIQVDVQSLKIGLQCTIGVDVEKVVRYVKIYFLGWSQLIYMSANTLHIVIHKSHSSNLKNLIQNWQLQLLILCVFVLRLISETI